MAGRCTDLTRLTCIAESELCAEMARVTLTELKVWFASRPSTLVTVLTDGLCAWSRLQGRMQQE